MVQLDREKNLIIKRMQEKSENLEEIEKVLNEIKSGWKEGKLIK